MLIDSSGQTVAPESHQNMTTTELRLLLPGTGGETESQHKRPVNENDDSNKH